MRGGGGGGGGGLDVAVRGLFSNKRLKPELYGFTYSLQF